MAFLFSVILFISLMKDKTDAVSFQFAIKRKIAILKEQNDIPEAIVKLNDYLKT